MSAIFYQIFIFHRMIALWKLWKMFFISSEKLFSFSRYSDFCISVFHFFLPVSHCFSGRSKKNPEIYDVINCLRKNVITYFVWYLKKEKGHGIESLSIDRVLNRDHFYGKIMQKICCKSYSQNPFFILVNIPKQPLRAKNYFRNKNFWKGII